MVFGPSIPPEKVSASWLLIWYAVLVSGMWPVNLSTRTNRRRPRSFLQDQERDQCGDGDHQVLEDLVAQYLIHYLHVSEAPMYTVSVSLRFAMPY